jgi:hypothetical protein
MKKYFKFFYQHFKKPRGDKVNFSGEKKSDFHF